MSDEDPYRHISQTSETQREAYLRRSSLHFLECAIHLCASHMSLEDVAQILEAEARMLREHG
ncbi:hypothetical protein DEM27_23815 [Metarhizobium album]|uniref:Uncharacterized protein n=1 Tax=Metarhizobium album TaxID=2182425 RepID=A0A2U2DKZ8_9HYPH|nr:hypothetical protein [Rhizobium album]PWE53941.1 hypothetical protein DEM27_23815 [Rhizobium album]